MSSVQPSSDLTLPAPTSLPSGIRRRRVAIGLLMLLLAPALAGCLRVQASLGVSSNDLVSGRIIAAVIPANPADEGPELQVPDSLAGKVRVEPYTQDGYRGSQVFFQDLTFGEVQQLGGLSEETQGMFALKFQRTGDLVSLQGRIDLKAVPPHGSDVQLTVAFPAHVATTNGTRIGESQVSWKIPAGDVTRLRAEVTYSDPDTRSFAGWAGIVGGVTLAVAAIVAAGAYLTRNPSPSDFSADTSSGALRQQWRQLRDRVRTRS